MADCSSGASVSRSMSASGVSIALEAPPDDPGAGASAVVQLTDWRTDWIKHLKYEAAKQRFEWAIAGNFWDELSKKHEMPTHAADTSHVRASLERHQQSFHCAPDLYAATEAFTVPKIWMSARRLE